MVITAAIFIIIILYDLPGFIRKKEPARIFIIYGFLMAASLSISLLLAAGKRPDSPAQFIEKTLRAIGVVK